MGEVEQDKGEPESAELESLLAEVKASRGVDLGGYKRTTLKRRILRRMSAVGVDGDFTRYRDLLREQPDELAALFDSVFINVTSFFRDPEAWAYLASDIIPRLVSQRGVDLPIRVWSAGCASGEEPFTIAMLLAEQLGLEAYGRRVKIYATDWDEAALQQARRARYPKELASVPERLRERYFEIEDGEAVLVHSLRRSVIFGQHDLLVDAPISRIDLLICRNTLMYFNADAQARILSRLHFALADDGVLFLGRAEMLLSHTESFAPIELRHRIFGKQLSDGPRRDLRPFAPQPPRRREREEDIARAARLREAALQASPVAQIVLDPQHRIAVINQRATELFPIGPPDLGRSLQDLELSYRPTDLRTMLDEAESERRSVHRKYVEHRLPPGDVQYLDVSVTPAFRDGALVAVTLTFADVTHHQNLQVSLQRFSENLETAYEELQSANEELETTNEELQAANDQLMRRDVEDQQANAFLNSILSSLRVAVAVVAEDLSVSVWNPLATELWGLRSEEVIGTSFADLDIGLPVTKLLGPIQECLAVAAGDGNDSREIMVDAINRRGRELVCRVLLAPIISAGIGRGVCILMEDATPASPAQEESG